MLFGLTSLNQLITIILMQLMFLSFNKRSILLATAIAFGTCGYAQAQADTKEIAIDFEAWVGDEEFVCGESYEGIGVNESTITPSDFRFYVSDVALIDEDGNAVPLELEQDGKWQYQNTVLLDFEDGTNACDNGTTDINTTVIGTVPKGDYQGIQFTMGVPQELNHEDAAIAPSPLNLTSMWWNWQGGYKFLRVDLETEAISDLPRSDRSLTIGQNEASSDRIKQNEPDSEQPSIFEEGDTPSETDSTRPDGHGDGEHNMMKMDPQADSNAYLIHLGSTGCSDSASSNLFSCANSNRVSVMLEDFDPEDNVVIADLAELLADSDLTTNDANTPNGCMSSPEDSDCQPIMQSLSLSTGDTEQKFFWVE